MSGPRIAASAVEVPVATGACSRAPSTAAGKGSRGRPQRVTQVTPSGSSAGRRP
jgi:hypothetical protein